MKYANVEKSLEFAKATNATNVTVKFDEGTHLMSLADAIAGWDQLLPGGDYEVLGIHWDDLENPLTFSGNEPTETERENLNERYNEWKLAVAVNNSKGEIPTDEAKAAAEFIEDLMTFSQISTNSQKSRSLLTGMVTRCLTRSIGATNTRQPASARGGRGRFPLALPAAPARRPEQFGSAGNPALSFELTLIICR